MFTDNYIKLQRLLFLNSNSPMVTASGLTKTAYRGKTAYHASFAKYMVLGRCRNLITDLSEQKTDPDNYIYPGVYFGSGSTPATKGDYTLESPITSGLAVTNGNIFENNDGNGVYTFSANYVLTNTSDAEINICETGIFLPIATDSNTSSMSNKFSNVLMERTVLDEPVTIAPGESKLFAYKITINQPTV